METKKLLLISMCLQAGVILIPSIALGTPFQQQKVTNEIQIREAAALIERIVPGTGASFSLSMIPKEGKLDVFEIEQAGNKIALRGSSGVALASAFNHYLKEFCKCHVSWCGDQLNLPASLPTVPDKIRIVGPHQYRVYFNYCTFCYTASWWDWKRWESEIDIMALNGINMPLSVTGLEGVWYQALLKFGFTDREAREFLAGPAFLAWQWMTNIEGHGGPLPKEWIDSHIELGRKILERQRGLGMTPIQQGFTGSVPRLFQKKFPDAAVSTERGWWGFQGTSQLDPLDPLFKKFGKIFLETEIELFGTSHVYAADPFHEGSPPKPGNEYLEAVGKEIWNLMKNVDPDAVWAMQSWSMRNSIAMQAPVGRLMILHLNSLKRKKNFGGHEFVNGLIQNFGGNNCMGAPLPEVASNPFAKAAKGKECVGMGLFMEAIEQNPVLYEMVFDSIWRDKPVNVSSWLNSYAERRYGAKSKNAEQAWQALLRGPYGSQDYPYNSSIIAARPAIRPRKTGPSGGGNGFSVDPKYDEGLAQAWNLLLADADILGKSEGYRFDVMDLTRQILSNRARVLVKEAADAYEAKDKAGFERASNRFLELLADMDRILATRNEYNFDTWVRNARAWGETEELKRYYEWNASMLVTIWGPEHEPEIFDYSWREWSGLIRLYYLPRWKMFYDHLQQVLDEGKTYQDPGRLTLGRFAFGANQFYVKLGKWELDWVRRKHDILPGPTGDTIAIARELGKKYRFLDLKNRR